MNRKIVMLSLLLKRNGFKRAEYIKKHNLFAKIGSNCYYHPFKIPSESYLIEFGNNVIISAGVQLVTHDMSYSLFKNHMGLADIIGNGKYPYYKDGIKIGNNVMVGLNTIILPGVTIGDNVIIGAGSVITKNVDSGVIVAGVPAKPIGSYLDYAKKRRRPPDSFV